MHSRLVYRDRPFAVCPREATHLDIVPAEHPLDSDQREPDNAIAERMFGRALWLRDNLPITPDEWGLLCLLIFGQLPEKRPTPEEFAQARAHHASLRGSTPISVDEATGVEDR